MFALKPIVMLLCVGLLLPGSALGEPPSVDGERSCCCVERTERPCCTKTLPAKQLSQSCGCQVRTPAPAPERPERRTGDTKVTNLAWVEPFSVAMVDRQPRPLVWGDTSPLGSTLLPLRILHCSWQI